VLTAQDMTGIARVYRVETTKKDASSARRFLRGPEEIGAAEGSYPACVIARAGDLRFIQLALHHRKGNFVNFDLASGTVTRSGDEVSSAQSVALGGGWYRLEVTFVVGKVEAADGLKRLVVVDHGEVGYHPLDTTVTGHFYVASPKFEAVANTEGGGAAPMTEPAVEGDQPKS